VPYKIVRRLLRSWLRYAPLRSKRFKNVGEAGRTSIPNSAIARHMPSGELSCTVTTTPALESVCRRVLSPPVVEEEEVQRPPRRAAYAELVEQLVEVVDCGLGFAGRPRSEQDETRMLPPP
jgi:hypothetical protein